ncbi:hypothetical protein [Kitasatospora sp. NPDC059817]|uniref:hypothetical protein n=1 Tax=Kitasatospora sp. NPDC059817 TaxID=3346961 RepID=UPI00365CDC2B
MPVCAGRPAAPFGDPSPQTCLQVAGEAALLAIIAADDAMAAVCRSRSGSTVRLEAAMHEAHREASEAARHADRAEQYADDPAMPASALVYCARKAVDHAVRAQAAAGVETTAASLRAELDRVLTPTEQAERESARRREEAQHEAEQRAATGMDRENRERAASNRYLAEHHVAALGWTTGHLRVMEAAATGRLYWRDRRARIAAQHGDWTGGRRVSQERTQALYAARFLVTTARTTNGARVLAPSLMGRVALELARLHQAALHPTDQAAYEARLVWARRRHRRRDDQKAAARRLPDLDPSARKLYRHPVTLAEQQARAEREATDRWEGEGGYCPAVEMPRPVATPTPTPAPPVPTSARTSQQQAVQATLW